MISMAQSKWYSVFVVSVLFLAVTPFDQAWAQTARPGANRQPTTSRTRRQHSPSVVLYGERLDVRYLDWAVAAMKGSPESGVLVLDELWGTSSQSAVTPGLAARAWAY